MKQNNNNMAKTKIRFKMPETNSSSSHSIAIYSEDDPSMPKSVLKLNQDGSVTIPDGNDFGQDWSFVNDPGTKAAYTISAILGLLDCRSNDYEKYKNMFEKVIKDYTGATSVKYGWADYSKKEKTIEKQFRNYFPRIDHQSISDAFDIICFSEDSMRDFIFSNQSHVIIGGEDYTPISVFLKYPKKEWKVKIIFYTGFKDGDLEIYLSNGDGNSIRVSIIDILEQLSYSTTNHAWGILTRYRLLLSDEVDSLSEFVLDVENRSAIFFSYKEYYAKFTDKDTLSRRNIDRDFVINNLAHKELKYDIIKRGEDVQ